MWNLWIYGLMAAEGLLLLAFIAEWVRKKKSEYSFLYILIAYGINAALCLIPYLYGGAEGNRPLELLECFTLPLKTFVGEGDYEQAKEFAKILPAYSWAYIAGVLLAMLSTVNAAVQAFSNTLRNRLRLFFALRRRSCDIVLGSEENALLYAEAGAAVLLPEPRLDRDGTQRLIERGYMVLHRPFSKELLSSRILNRHSRYNIICPGKTEENLAHIEAFIDWCRAGGRKAIHLYVEIEADRAKMVSREIIDPSGFGEQITTFCSDELLARRFTEEHPFTEHLPRRFLEEDTAIRPEARLQEIYLGFGSLNREMYRQGVLNHQLVSYEGGEYRLHPIDYHLFDADIDTGDWIIDGLKDTRISLMKRQEEYYPLPPLPYETLVHPLAPFGREALREAEALICREDTFTNVIIDVGDSYRNIELGARLRRQLGERADYHIYIRSEVAYQEADERITYLAKLEEIFDHDTIVNDGMARIAYALNEIYTRRNIENYENRSPSREEVEERARADWRAMDHFTRYSNLYSARNLRLKLQLLGLDYQRGAGETANGQNGALLKKYYPQSEGKAPYEDYFSRSIHSALLAQEKYRWNAYHLMEEILPMPRAEVQAVKEGERIRMITKTAPLRRHACLTTYAGLDDLSKDLAAKKEAATGKPCRREDFDYYQYDDQLLLAVGELMERLGYSIIEKA